MNLIVYPFFIVWFQVTTRYMVIKRPYFIKYRGWERFKSNFNLSNKRFDDIIVFVI